MANFAANLTVDLHEENHIVKNVEDNAHNVAIAEIQKGLRFCTSHKGTWVAKPGYVFGMYVRDCPDCKNGVSPPDYDRDQPSTPLGSVSPPLSPPTSHKIPPQPKVVENDREEKNVRKITAAINRSVTELRSIQQALSEIRGHSSWGENWRVSEQDDVARVIERLQKTSRRGMPLKELIQKVHEEIECLNNIQQALSRIRGHSSWGENWRVSEQDDVKRVKNDLQAALNL